MRCALQFVSNYQYGSPVDLIRRISPAGTTGGVADAQTALRLHAAAGGGDSAPIFFSVDEDIDLNTWKSVAVEWFRGINSGVCVGDPRRRNWVLNHRRALVGMADECVVSR